MTTTPTPGQSSPDSEPTRPLNPSGGDVQQQYAQQQYVPQQPQAQQPQAPYQHSTYSAQPQPRYAQPTQQAEHAHYASSTQYDAAPPETHDDDTRSRSRGGALLTGLAVGALLGGLVGGGVAAVVSANSSGSSAVQGGGSLTLENGESATAISGVAAVATPSVVTIDVAGSSASGSGSGVIYSEDGYIITNAHVATLDGAAAEPSQIRVKLSDGRILDGDLVGVDPYADLAVIKVEAEGLPAIEVADSSELNVGDLTVAIGAPLNLSNTVTSGVVSALNRGIAVGSPLIPEDTSEQQEDDSQPEGPDSFGFPWDFRFDSPEQDESQQPAAGGSVTLPVIQTDASINPGNSGGALLNAAGELIGVNVAIANTGGSAETAGSVGLGFAIPSNLATRVADALIAGEQPSHGLLGASVGDSYQDTDEDANFSGGLVVDVTSGSAADRAGLRAGDVITAVNGVPAADGTSVSGLIRMNEGGSEVTLDFRRGGEEQQATATLDTLEW